MQDHWVLRPRQPAGQAGQPSLEEALQTRQALVNHSDKNIQYCSNGDQRIHQRHGFTYSMTDGYDCYQNALAEHVEGILKMEFLLQRSADINQARKAS